MNRRIELQDMEDSLQRQTWYLDPGRYQDLFLAGAFDETPDPLTLPGSDIEEVDDISVLDSYWNQLEEKRLMSGAMIDALDRDEGGWM